MPRAPTLFLKIALAALVLAAGGLWPRDAPAEIYRCHSPSGGMMYTDRRCEDMGAVPAPVGSHQMYRGPARDGCARNVSELILRISSAVGQQDTNQLAEVYHWAGMSGRQSVSVLKRLEAVVQKPLAGIVRVMPGTSESADGTIPDPEYYARRPVNERPVGLRLEQYSADGITPSSTVFGLHRHFDCWWIRN